MQENPIFGAKSPSAGTLTRLHGTILPTVRVRPEDLAVKASGIGRGEANGPRSGGASALDDPLAGAGAGLRYVVPALSPSLHVEHRGSADPGRVPLHQYRGRIPFLALL